MHANDFKKHSKLEEINTTLKKETVYSHKEVSTLRDILGDWTKPLIISNTTVLDESEKTDLYLAQGLEPSLKDVTYDETSRYLVVAGVQTNFLLIPEDINRGINPEEAGYQRLNRAHNILQRLENRFRQFIIERMKAFYGDNWLKQNIPGAMRLRWEEKKAVALAAGGRDEHLIYYAEFSDYSQIIVSNKNWENVFEPYFKRKDSIQESFQRLYPLRHSTMHSRPITEIDELYLSIEAHRLFESTQ